MWKGLQSNYLICIIKGLCTSKAFNFNGNILLLFLGISQAWLTFFSYVYVLGTIEIFKILWNTNSHEIKKEYIIVSILKVYVGKLGSVVL